MQLNVKYRDGPARIGELTVEDKKIITPNIFFIDTDRYKAPNFADLIITQRKKIDNNKTALQITEKHPEKQKNNEFIIYNNILNYPKDLTKEIHISRFNNSNNSCMVIPADIEIIDEYLKNNSTTLFFIVSNVLQLYNQPKKFTEFIITLREKIGYEKNIYLPSLGEPSNFALLSYLGVDFFDSTSAIVAARNNQMLFSNGVYNKEILNEIPCSCIYCEKRKNKPNNLTFEDILNHNYLMIYNEIKQVRNSIRIGNIRSLVEKKILDSSIASSIFKNINQQNFDFLEKRTPITSKIGIIATSKESFLRPEIIRFQKRVINRYNKPKSAEILLLLPCSAVKPYSFSKSHKIIRNRTQNNSNPYIIHELIITSPIGIVPRELELIYPASAYDIPVTGFWDEDEKKMIQSLLKSYLEKNHYKKIISHLPSEILEFIEDILPEYTNSCINHPTSDESLDKLENILKDEVKKFENIKQSQRKIEYIYCLSQYQFGEKITKNLLKKCTIRGKYPYYKIIFNDKQIGMTTLERGLISLTKEGAFRILNSENYWVDIYDDFKLIGSVFAPGVKNADTEIRPGDEVIIKRNGQLCGVGVAQMNGEEMIHSTYGEAVKIRHIV